MPAPTHPSARRVQEALRVAGSAAEVRELADSTRTSAEAAAALGVAVGQIAKSVVFRSGERTVVVVASGEHRVDPARVAGVLGGEGLRRADAEQVRAGTGYPIGGVSPVALPDQVVVVVDEALAGYDVVWAAAGTPRSVFPTTFAELLALTGGVAADVREEPA